MNEETKEPIRVIIADDHVLYRAGVKASLSTRNDVKVIAEADNGMHLLNLIKNIEVPRFITNIGDLTFSDKQKNVFFSTTIQLPTISGRNFGFSVLTLRSCIPSPNSTGPSVCAVFRSSSFSF